MQAILQKKSSKFTALFTGDSTAFNYYLESVDLRVKGQWKNGGDKLIRCAEQYSTLRMFLEAAAVYCEAGDCYLKVDKDEAQKAWAQAVKIFCDLNHYDISGRLEKRMADMHFGFKHYEDAALHYRKAANFLLNEPDQSDACLERSAEALIWNGDCEQSHLIYENIGISCAKTNLRSFQANRMLMMAILCLFGTEIIVTMPSDADHHHHKKKHKDEPERERVYSKPDHLVVLQHRYQVKYDEIKQKIAEYDTFTATWSICKERRFVSNLLAFRMEENFNQLVDHIYYWNNIRPLSAVALKLLKIPTDEAKEMTEKRQAIAKAEAEAAAKATSEKKSKKLIPAREG